MPETTRPPRTVEELIPFLEENGIHLHYGFAHDRWTLVGVSQHALKYCSLETCYRLRIKNHREYIEETTNYPRMREVCCLTCKETINSEQSIKYVPTAGVDTFCVCGTVLEEADE